MPIARGNRFGRLLVVGLSKEYDSHKKAHWIVQCDCGVYRTVREDNLLAGHSTSCGCYRIERVKESATVHGDARDGKTPEYQAWRSMIARCYEPRTHSYKWYGGKGIGVCARWLHSYEDFREDMGARPSSDHRLSRVDPAKDFTPENTCWSTHFEVGRKRGNNQFHEINGLTLCLEDWAERSGINKSTLHYRLAKGLTMREAIDLGHGRRGKNLPK